MEKSIRIRLLEREYALRVAPEHEEHTRAYAAYVDRKLKAFRTAHPDQTETTAALITALALAEELFAAREEVEALRRATEDEIVALERRLGSALATP